MVLHGSVEMLMLIVQQSLHNCLCYCYLYYAFCQCSDTVVYHNSHSPFRLFHLVFSLHLLLVCTFPFYRLLHLCLLSSIPSLSTRKITTPFPGPFILRGDRTWVYFVTCIAQLRFIRVFCHIWFSLVLRYDSCLPLLQAPA